MAVTHRVFKSSQDKIKDLLEDALSQSFKSRGINADELIRNKEPSPSGYDFYIKANGIERYIRISLKVVDDPTTDETTDEVDIRPCFAKKPGSCVIWISFGSKSGASDIRWKSGEPDESLNDLERNGVIKLKEHRRKKSCFLRIGKDKFDSAKTLEEVVEKLFPTSISNS